MGDRVLLKTKASELSIQYRSVQLTVPASCTIRFFNLSCLRSKLRKICDHLKRPPALLVGVAFWAIFISADKNLRNFDEKTDVSRINPNLLLMNIFQNIQTFKLIEDINQLQKQ